MRLPLTKHPGILAVSVLVIGLLVWGFWPRPVLVELVEAQRAPMTVTIEEEGRTRVTDRFIISAPVDGVACRVQLDVGDTVQAGQTLLSISPLESRVLDPRSRAEAEARVAAAREGAGDADGHQHVADRRQARGRQRRPATGQQHAHDQAAIDELFRKRGDQHDQINAIFG